jgi:putative membrane-bound dehydrogenase-like protein
LGLKVAPGFRVSLYADHELANDIYAMTLDSHGRVVVTSRGYIKVLHDTRGTGKADRATLFAESPTGGMGMCFDGNDLYFCGDGWFSCYRDSEGKGRADKPPDRFIRLAFAEHGGHAMRKGPDGWWYIIGGNDSGIGRQHVTLPHSPVKEPDVGAILRLTPDCSRCEVIAHGFRNPYDFDFNYLGDLFTYDSDVEREFFLPWYTPTRIFHVGYAAHHGWQLTGYLRGWSRPDYSPDTVDILWPVGRGSPTGLTCYRHHQFPEHYRDGLFVLDWTFGKVYFFPLEANGSTYRTRPEVFLESIGTNGFDPTDIAVAPDGSLFICMGGRGTRGAVFRVDYVGGENTNTKQIASPPSELDSVLDAPQPLDAWSRVRWLPIARRLGPAPFIKVIEDEAQSAKHRVRAIEVMTEVFGGLPKDVATSAARSSEAFVRSRVAWSLDRQPCGEFGQILAKLAEDGHAHVRRTALEALADHWPLPGIDSKQISARLADSDKRVRQAAARLAAMLPDKDWQQLWERREQLTPQGRLSLGLAACWRKPDPKDSDAVVELALSVLSATNDVDLRLQAVRLIILAWGDCHFKNPGIEIHTGYSFQYSPRGKESLIRRILGEVRPLFPSGDERLDTETSRLLAMLEDDDPSVPERIASFWTPASSPTRDVHYLIVFSRLRGGYGTELRQRFADTMLSLHLKLEGKEQRVKQVWNDRLSELVTISLRRDPRLAVELVQHPKFVSAGHVGLALGLPADARKQAARLYLQRVQHDSDFPWSGDLVELLGGLSYEKVVPVLRARWSDYSLREAIVLQLCQRPEPEDREKYLSGLQSGQDQVVLACLRALEKLPNDHSAENLVPLLRLLRRLEREPAARPLRQLASSVLGKQMEQPFTIAEKQTGFLALQRAYEPVFKCAEQKYPAAVRALGSGANDDVADWSRVLKNVEWSKGDSARGQKVFRDRTCETCHAGTRALGPDLSGVASRLSREDLFTAIIDPSRDVAPAYRTTTVETRDGQLHTGIIIFESADGLIVQTGAATTVRLSTPEIVSRFPSTRSLMPDGLLKDLKAADLADLYRYLQTLTAANSLKGASK